MTLTVGSLFSGIGGLDLGLERAGMRVVWQAEIDPYCSRVLAKHWPDVPNLGDVTKIDWSEVPVVDLICGGYPCQPFSLAGRRDGEDDPRHLWPHMRDAIRVLRPRYALLENVPGHLSMGFGRVLGDLAEIGYDTQWDCIPAAAVGAPHLRWRVFVVAYPRGERRQQVTGSAPSDEGTDARWTPQDHHVIAGDGESGRTEHVADPEGVGRPNQQDSDRARVALGSEPRPSGRTGRGNPASGTLVDQRGPSLMASPVADPSCQGLERQRLFHHPRTGSGPIAADGGRWPAEPDVGRVADGVPARVDRLRALGNAVVPQVAEHIGRLITEAAADQQVAL